MALDKQVYIYNLDTSMFYNEKEKSLHKRLNKMYLFRKSLQKRKNGDERVNKYLTNVNRRIRNLKDILKKEIKCNEEIRQLDEEYMNDHNVISIFESALTRILQIPTDTLSTDIMVVRTYFFDVLKDLIFNGFLYNGEKYIFFTASAGQIRTKRSIFIKESVYKKHEKTLMCGLTVDHINKLGGINVNKFIAYLALCNSATDVWEDFDIDKAIVVDDLETLVRGTVDFINDKDYSITRKEMDVPINHTDGCGMVLPQKCSKNMIIRLPWIKGLISPFPYNKFINNNNSKVKDIYGKEWDILEDGIEVIFTKSQFKMHKFYKNWDDYKEKYKKYGCHAGKCNEEMDVFDNKKLAYQMLQTLTDMTDDEIRRISYKTKKDIVNLGSNRDSMLRVLGVTKGNKNKNYLQQAIEIYPELLNDTYSRQILKQLKKKLVRDAMSGKIDISAKYTYIVPDLYAFCEYLFLKDNNPNGLLKNKEVYCSLYDNNKDLDCLRSPHLYREHAVRVNVIDDEKKKWFITNGLYISCHDLFTKIIMCDVDGDTSLVVDDKLFVNIAKRNMRNIVPLYYKMAAAKAEKITKESLFVGITTAYSGGNIGIISNNISKVWNSENIDLEVIKLLTFENNFTIDYAKTLYKPKRPACKNKKIKKYTNKKLPHFFIYAKKKNKKQVAKRSGSVVDSLELIIPNPPISFKKVGLDEFNYKMLMSDKNTDINTNKAKRIIEKYIELDLKKFFIINRNIDKDEETNDKIGNLIYLYKQIRNSILELDNDEKYVTDVLIEYLYNHKKSNFKTTLWECFGDVIVDNLRMNIDTKYVYCDICGDLISPTNNKMKYCHQCAREKQLEWQRESMKKIRNKNM